MGSRHLCHLTFTLSKFTLEKFLFLEMVSNIHGVTKHFLCFYGQHKIRNLCFFSIYVRCFCFLLVMCNY